MDARKIYKKLLAHFGPQGWWPIFDKKTQKCAYFNCRIPETLLSFEICVGAILTQNTAWKNVEKALCNLITFAHSRELANVTPEFILSCKNLEALIQPAGYYNQKAKKLRIFSEWWLSRCHCEKLAESAGGKEIPQKMRLPRSFQSLAMTDKRKEILSLWGIGPETADSILLYAFGKPIFVIDAYTKRLCKECGVEFKNYDEYRKFFESQLPKSVKLFNEYHALIVAWGKLQAKNKEAAVKIVRH